MDQEQSPFQDIRYPGREDYLFALQGLNYFTLEGILTIYTRFRLIGKEKALIRATMLENTIWSAEVALYHNHLSQLTAINLKNGVDAVNGRIAGIVQQADEALLQKGIRRDMPDRRKFLHMIDTHTHTGLMYGSIRNHKDLSIALHGIAIATLYTLSSLRFIDTRKEEIPEEIIRGGKKEIGGSIAECKIILEKLTSHPQIQKVPKNIASLALFTSGYLGILMVQYEVQNHLIGEHFYPYIEK